MLSIFQTTLELGALYAFVSIALFISYRLLDIADLTTDGSFVLGMAISVSCTFAGHPILGILLGMLAGGAAGYITAFLQTRMGVPSIISGIITSTGLYTVNLFVMGWSSQISLLKQTTVFSMLKKTNIGGSWYASIFVIVLLVVCMILLRLFLSTRLGLSLRATGDNRAMVTASSVNVKNMITLGLVMANMLVGLSGALVGQFNKTSDINAGTGIVVVGLACLIIGESLLQGRKSLSRNSTACFIGNVVYRMIYAVILQTKIINVQSLKLVTAVIVALAVAAPTIKKELSLHMRKGK